MSLLGEIFPEWRGAEDWIVQAFLDPETATHVRNGHKVTVARIDKIGSPGETGTIHVSIYGRDLSTDPVPDSDPLPVASKVDIDEASGEIAVHVIEPCARTIADGLGLLGGAEEASAIFADEFKTFANSVLQVAQGQPEAIRAHIYVTWLNICNNTLDP